MIAQSGTFDDTRLPVSLYLHIPFCRTICTYCAFNTYADLDDLIPAFVDALCQEMRFVGASRSNIQLKTIYFGGGTPSLLTAKQYEQLFATIEQVFDTSQVVETTLESNPNDLSFGYLRDLRAVGFNRISIGAQTANQRELSLYGRRHDFDEVVHAVSDARQAGFQNISLDLIYGAPDQTVDEWGATLAQAIALQPDHFSLYNLELKGGTVLTHQVDVGELTRPDDDVSADMYDLATDCLGEGGYQQYEISNWSRPGYESEHNLQYWRNLPYLGLGPGAHGFASGVRYNVLRLPQRYIDRLAAAQHSEEYPRTPVTAKAIAVDRETDMQETIMMGMRMLQEGIQRDTFRQRFGVDIVDEYADAIKKHQNYGLLSVDDEKISLTQQGRFLSNAVIRDFF
ncbi:radical SAM family heme chaperone HemW [Phototrophicus methaneseepsis]|uniref:Heme chaperone HemW n=1 Tax=Phototrophicus methaneseepsis TaxID=2710758 RepID=A0A7S8E6B3_9CHLR|nr:radical SAM family heme chaperone HemW [Phototrophicus methaneseepsis]QPC81183.1 radical SAM family heme chaperone HemW [Phototrophicus methaneseepsis]